MTSISTKAKLFFKFALRDIECGLHSGYKPCCIFCFSILDNLSILDKRRFYKWRRLYNLVVEKFLNKYFRYIPCPVCVWLKPIEPNKCPKDQTDNTIHPLDLLSEEEFKLFNLIKDLYPIHEDLIEMEILLNWILPPGGIKYFI